jgi:hypothetical protein
MTETACTTLQILIARLRHVLTLTATAMALTARLPVRRALQLTAMTTMRQSIRELLLIAVMEPMKIAAEQPMKVMLRQVHCAAKVFAHQQGSQPVRAAK